MFGFLVKYLAFATKNSKVVHLRFVTGNDLVWGLVQILLEIKPVDGMTSRVDGFGPKDIRSLVLI